MAVTVGQVAVPANASGAVTAAVVSPGSTVSLAVPTGGQAVWIGEGTAAATTTGTGYPLTAGGLPLTFTVPVTSQPVSLFVINNGATPTTLGVIVVTTY